ncbi:hypothetical protein SZN_08424 [Streptomyces zinciresistens K42]|uniref:DUF397 domain-containing protein n=1 Tax=Streptomyces zinciresistens K42 TaxID=700597 RepID=G2G871_9ACTN|nr:DUF397 domain-containing protein [Streptomyces zinciresistens]EGX60359.1 hypothetical protein SZN_08424 [Streptomyces zinciresistens K42]
MKSIPDHELSAADWHKSSYSGGGGGNCLEYTRDFLPAVPVRDSKTPQGPALVFGAEPWSAFVNAVRI